MTNERAIEILDKMLPNCIACHDKECHEDKTGKYFPCIEAKELAIKVLKQHTE